jgi:hypothetical protein
LGCPWVSESKRPKADISFVAGYLAVLKTFI